MSNYKSKLNDITTFIFDVDGVLTDGSVILMPDGSLTRIMNTRDGYAMKLALDKGYKIAIITGGRDKQIKERLSLLGIKDIYLGISDKIEVYHEFLLTYDLKNEEILYMGDDVPDYEVLKEVGLSSCPHDAVNDIREIVSYVSPVNGGKGCVRDVIEQTLKAQGKWVMTEKPITSTL
jgi:3-deoxy-D-manno-octulosonate 8-phosphate phosphatase (KDO 8-P phosphatase)